MDMRLAFLAVYVIFNILDVSRELQDSINPLPTLRRVSRPIKLFRESLGLLLHRPQDLEALAQLARALRLRENQTPAWWRWRRSTARSRWAARADCT